MNPDILEEIRLSHKRLDKKLELLGTWRYRWWQFIAKARHKRAAVERLQNKTNDGGSGGGL